jgi:hypothetical protein
MVEIPEAFVVAVEGLSPADRTHLIRALVSSRSDPQDRIRQLYERNPAQVTAMPMDLEADRAGPAPR